MSEAATIENGVKLTMRQILAGVGVCVLVLSGLAITYANGGMDAWMEPFFSPDQADQVDLAQSLSPLPVNVATITFVDSIEQVRNYTGTIRARQRSDLGFELAGQIKAVHVDEGDTVEKGQLLAELDLKTINAQKGVIVARIAQAKSVMAELEAGPRRETIRAAQAVVDEAKSSHDHATATLQRRSNLREARALSTAEFEQAAYAVQAALAVLNVAKEKLAELKAGTRQEKIAAQRSVIQQLESSRQEIDVAISKSHLIAPFSGTVTRRYLDPGSIAPASAPIIKLVQQNRLEAWIGLPVSVATEVELQKEYTIQIDRNRFSATASAKIQELDPATRTQTVLFELDPMASEKVVSGQLCEIQFVTSVNTSGCWIPTSALTRSVRGLWSVMVITPDESGNGFRTEKRDIEVIKTESNRVLARGTVEEGDLIVADGIHRVSEDQWVVPSKQQDIAL